MRRGTWALLLGAVTAAYVGWVWPSDSVDYSRGQVGGFLLTVLVLMGMAVRSGLRPTRVVNMVLATLLAVAFVDVVAVDGDDLWLYATFFYGPLAWLCTYVPALLLEDRLWPAPSSRTSSSRPPHPTGQTPTPRSPRGAATATG